MTSRVRVLRSLVLVVLFGALLIVSVFTLSRGAMLLAFADSSLLGGRSKEVARLFRLGLRYDVKTAAIALAPFTVVGLLLLAWPRPALAYARRLHVAVTALFLASLAASIGNHYYYATFQSYFDVFVFGLFEEGPRAVLSTIWHGYPVLPWAAAIVAAGLVVGRTAASLSARLLSRQWKGRSPIVEASGVLAFLACYALAVRGSFGSLPLEGRDAQVSSLKVLNMLVPNGVMALEWAIADHRKERAHPRAGDAEGRALFSAFLGRDVPPGDVSLGQFADRTSASPLLEKSPPHVVLAVMESLSTHLLTLDSPPETDLLGALRPYWRSGFTFLRFLPEGSSTMDSLARLLVASPDRDITRTRAQRTRFVSNILEPYRRNGYRTLFVTSGNGAWRNLSNFLTQLGFDEVVEQSDLLRRYPGAEEGAWGTLDEYAFRYVAERLEEAEGGKDRLFVVMLSTTCHPPYAVPAAFRMPPGAVDAPLRRRLSGLPGEVESVLSAFRYSNDALGLFLRRVDGGAAGGRTLVAVTGDHNVRGVGYPDPAESVLRYAVPFFLRVPQAYRAPGIVYDPRRVGSHKDIMPTLYCLSLSDTPYFRRGFNLLAEEKRSPWYFGYNPEMVVTDEGAWPLKGAATFLPWRDGEGLFVSTGGATGGDRLLERARWEAYGALLRWQLDRQINEEGVRPWDLGISSS